MLVVPHFRQKSPDACLPACVRMVLAYRGRTHSEKELVRALGTVNGLGTNPETAIAGLENPRPSRFGCMGIMIDVAVEDVTMTTTVNAHEAKTQLSQLPLRVSVGEDAVIAKAGKPVVRLVAFDQKPIHRTPGSAKGQVWLAPDFNASLPDDILETFDA